MPGGRGGVGSPYWFEEAFGFKESSYDKTKKEFEFADGVLTSKANGASFHVGSFEDPSLEDLRTRLASAAASPAPSGGLAFRNIVGDARALHRAAGSAGAVFQVASQFNCLEMNEPGARPEDGVTRYYCDATQGPACALSCPAATVYRNYMVHGHGQGHGRQIDCLSGVGDLVNNGKEKYWRMVNGYCLPTAAGSIGRVSKLVQGDAALAEAVRARVRVGVHWDTEVAGGQQRVCQVFCSALPVAYAKQEKAANWMPFACAVLDACFEATLAAAALLAAQRQQRVKVFLTAVGGGAFGNRSLWICASIQRALAAHADSPLDVALVHFATIPRGPYKGLDTQRASASAGRSHSPPPVPHQERRAQPAEGAETRPDAEPEQEKQDKAQGSSAQDLAADGGATEPSPPSLQGERSTGEELMALFSRLDANGDGVIGRDELKAVLQRLDAGLSDEAVDRIFAAADANADGQIHYAEFVAWVCNEDSAVMARMVGLANQPSAPPAPPIAQPVSSSGSDGDPLWPLDKLRAALAAWEGPPPKNGFAVLLSTGAMNPPHAGHVQLLHQARQHLETAGYGILAAWLSPSHDGYVQPKAQSMKAVGLSSEFRLEVARRAIAAEDGLVDVGRWEARKPGHWPDYPEVVKALQEALGSLPEAARLRGRCDFVQVFYACGTDHAQKCGLYRGLRPERHVGVVVVPRAGERAQREKPDALVFVADPAAGDVAGLSSTKVRKALVANDHDFLGRALPAGAVEFLLRPTAEQHEAFRGDFRKLKVHPATDT